MTAALGRFNSRTFASLRYRNYRLFFAGQTVSQTGSWMQRIALGWFVLQITHSPFAVGLMALAQFLPFMVFGLFAGVLTDRLDARRTVIGTQALQLVSAIALSWIALASMAEPWMLYTIAFANGMVLVLDVPSRQQLTYRMVGRESLPNAIALNSSLFNASRIFGPAVAGIVYGFAGAGVCFLFNAVSFFAVLLSLFWMRVGDFFPLEAFERPSILRGTREGLGYVRRQKRMVVLLSLTVVLSTFCFNFNVTLPVLAYSTLHTNAQVYGLLSALFGAGALVGSLGAASLGRASAKVLLTGSLVFTGLRAPARAPALAGRDRRAALLRRRRLHRLVGELERDDAARGARPAPGTDHRPLLLRVQRHGSARRALRRLAVRPRRHRARVLRRRRDRPARHARRRARLPQAPAAARRAAAGRRGQAAPRGA